MTAALVFLVAFLFSAGAVLIAIEHRAHKSSREDRFKDWRKFAVYLVLLTLLLSLGLVGKTGIVVVLAAVAMAGGGELASTTGAVPARKLAILGLSILVLAASLAHLLAGPAQTWYAQFVFTILVVSATDSYSQLWGKLLGKRKLCPRISPGKSWEGFAGGLVSAVVVAATLGAMLQPYSVVSAAVIGLLLALAAVAGDLLFSILKRRRGIKDFSSLLPAHGGVLDRFDSLVVAAPVSYWLTFLAAG